MRAIEFTTLFELSTAIICARNELNDWRDRRQRLDKNLIRNLMSASCHIYNKKDIFRNLFFHSVAIWFAIAVGEQIRCVNIFMDIFILNFFLCCVVKDICYWQTLDNYFSLSHGKILMRGKKCGLVDVP